MRLFCRRPAVSLPVARPARPPADEPPRGCGWFDSSHDLQHGLRVTEHDEFGAVGPLLPLSWWLAWELDEALPSPGSQLSSHGRVRVPAPNPNETLPCRT